MIKALRNKSIFAIVISLLIAMGAALVGFTGLTARAEGGLDIGSGKAISVTIPYGETVTATVEDSVAEGQYFLYFDVTTPDYKETPEEYWNIYVVLSWENGGETYYEYMSYNQTLGMYYAELSNIKGGDVISFSAEIYSEYQGEVSGQAYLGGLALGEFNDYELGNLRLPADVELRLTPDSYLISVAPYYYGPTEEDEPPFEPTYTVTIGGRDIPLVQDPNLSYTYTARIDVTDTVMATISGVNAGDYAVDLRIYNYVEPIELSDTETTVEMNFGETYLFSYVAGKTGYLQMVATAVSGETAVEPHFSLASKASDIAISVENYPVFDYPLYVEQGHTYFYEVSYSGEEDPDKITATISFKDWEAPTVTLDEVFYVPTNESVSLAFSGDFNVGIATFPNNFDPTNDTVTLNLVRGEATEAITLDVENYFLWQGSLDGVTALNVTWNDMNAVFGILVEYTPIEGEITVGNTETITLPAGRDGRYTVSGLTANVPYKVTLTDITNASRVEVSGPNGVIVAEGETAGEFIASEWEVDYFMLNIFNYDEENTATFSILVEENKENIEVLNLNADNLVTLAGYETRVYRIDLPVGEYAMRISGDTNIRAYTANGTIVDEYNDAQVGRLSVSGESETVTVYIFFTNVGSESVSATVLLTDLAGGIELDNEDTITLSAHSSVAYAMDLANGTYLIILGSEVIEVTVGNTVVIEYGYSDGEFEVSAVGTETSEVILFFTNDNDEDATFTVSVMQA